MKEYGIYEIDFGEGRGREQGRSRPAILFKLFNELGIGLVIPLTSNKERLNLPYTVPINKTSSTNLSMDSVALVFQLRAIDRTRITERQIGNIEEYQINKIRSTLKEMFAL